MNKHTCREADYCICAITALEPDEECPVHGWPWPPRCDACGRFMFRKVWPPEPVDKLKPVEHP
jgi:hypothetical protein